MSHKEVYKSFKLLFPNITQQGETWFPNGKSCIRIRQVSGAEFIFTCNGHNDWRFETVNSYIKGLKGEK